MVGIYQGDSIKTLTRLEGETVNGGTFEGFRIAAVAGQTYHICIDGVNAYWHSPAGPIILHIVPPQNNDSFSTPKLLLGERGVFEGATFEMSVEPGEPNLLGWNPYAASLWWNWEAPASGDAIFTISPIEWEGFRAGNYIGVFKGSTLETFVPA